MSDEHTNDTPDASAAEGTTPINKAVESDEDLKGTFQDETLPPPNDPPHDPHTQRFEYSEGDLIFIHANAGKFIAEVDKAYRDYAAAEADYDLSFQTIVKKGPLYDYEAPHYLCHLANPGKSKVGACELDTTLKARYED